MTNGKDEEYYEFDEQAVAATLETVRQPDEERRGLLEAADVTAMDRGQLELRAQCIEVVTGNRRVCLRLPLGIGRVCIPVPVNLPSGTKVRACLDIRTTLGIPTGVCVSLYVGGERVARKCFP